MLNINSIEHKMTHVSAFLKNKEIDILVVQETKVNPLINDDYLTIDGDNLIRRDRVENMGGGILV